MSEKTHREGACALRNLAVLQISVLLRLTVTVFWNMTPYGLVVWYLLFREYSCLMQAVGASETSVRYCQTSLRRKTEDSCVVLLDKSA
jgi:hypothetical protein